MIFVGESNLERKLKEAYVQNSFAKHYFAHLYAKGKVKGISLKEGLIKWKEYQIYVLAKKLHTKVI
jgi:hypothetical protein